MSGDVSVPCARVGEELVEALPAMYSIARKATSPIRPASNTVTMCSWFSRATARASRSKRAVISGDAASSGRTTFSATRRPRRSSSAR